MKVVQPICRCLVAFSLLVSTTVKSAEPALSNFIVNKTVNVEALTQEELSQIFRFQVRMWPNTSKIVVVLPPIESFSFRNLATNELGINSAAYYEIVNQVAKEYVKNGSLIFAPSDAFVVVKV